MRVGSAVSNTIINTAVISGTPRNIVLYITRSLREHTLLQAIARVNRLHPGKDYGYIIDYYGNLENLDKALETYSGDNAYDEEDLAGTFTNINDEIKKMDLFGETEIHNFLRKYKIPFKERHNLHQILFDFYLPTLRVCIEFDGRQHFEPIERFGGVDTLERIKSNDKVKNEYCEEHYIELVRIKYDKIDDIYRILWDNLAHKIKKTN